MAVAGGLSMRNIIMDMGQRGRHGGGPSPKAPDVESATHETEFPSVHGSDEAEEATQATPRDVVA